MKTHTKNDCTIIILDERLTFDDHHEFSEITKSITTPKLEVDFFKTQYIDSAALGMLLVLRDQNMNVVLKNAQGDVKKILDIANFDKLFEMIQ